MYVCDEETLKLNCHISNTYTHTNEKESQCIQNNNNNKVVDDGDVTTQMDRMFHVLRIKKMMIREREKP